MDETEEADLETLFSGFINTSENCRQELINEVTKLGGTPADGTRADGKLYRIWMDLKAAVTGKDRKAILSSCEYGEDVAVHTYEKALKDTSALTPGLQAIITSQHAKIKADHDKVKSMRDALVEA